MAASNLPTEATYMLHEEVTVDTSGNNNRLCADITVFIIPTIHLTIVIGISPLVSCLHLQTIRTTPFRKFSIASTAIS